MVQILDTTLREGEQTPGVYFDSHIKLAIAEQLDVIGVDFIEAGHPVVSNEVCDAVKNIAQRNIRAVIAAHSRSWKKDIDQAISCGVGFIGIFYCVSEQRLNGVFKKDLKTAIAQIAEVIRYAKQQNPNIIIRYTPEDTVRSEFNNVIEAAVAATKAGADIISIADTTGFMVPGTERNMYDYVRKLKTALTEQNQNPKIAVHCHNDRGFALANAIDAFRAGVDIIDASVLGLGERAGIVDLAQLLTVLKIDFGVENNWNLKQLQELYNLVSEHSGIAIPVNNPVMGENAFTHCAGVHTNAAINNPLHYQSLDPNSIGREMRISLDHMSGISSLKYVLKKIGETELNDDLINQVLEIIKSVGQKGKIVRREELKIIINLIKNKNNKEIIQQVA
ncbi:2-isopropylmalate synthase [Candidatus Woesearchaeota archaeon]|jgi:2-isopropylmalate synthase|nr:2-isopropylmalate synthase [Candidatus Woesearchaeota archaeon]MBT5272745.1 2-isopropylmalate synthase [Candidatus Woesearchaeota archaeon]MBT6040356.1 2-isopropylmalate synthase [Candidatus Woesearchaeota archaeon]MBT6337010.1 2-isopropylmalate synthase [Candidatus Woesearchaeota archaeon]MBT7926896.1 2-isopropylmalate synthase [Candidatus Woesearchaeota archaeon]